MQLPLPHVIRAIIQRYARLRVRLGDDLGDRPLVLPSADFFPDAYHHDSLSAALLADRMLEHAGMVDIPVRTKVVRLGEEAKAASSCGSGSCGLPQASSQGIHRVADEGQGWLLQVPEPELRHPVALTTNLARSLAFIFLMETKRDDEVLEPPVDVTADFTAVALGFGPLMLQGSYIYAKSCGGPQIASVTKVSLPELSVAVALFAALSDQPLAAAFKHLDVTQRSVLGDAAELLRANKRLVAKLRTEPESVARGTFELEEPGGLFSRLFRARKEKSPAPLDPLLLDLDINDIESLTINMPPSSTLTGRPSRPPTGPVRDELKELVAEALQSARV